jgi:hypothetical protein
MLLTGIKQGLAQASAPQEIGNEKFLPGLKNSSDFLELGQINNTNFAGIVMKTTSGIIILKTGVK